MEISLLNTYSGFLCKRCIFSYILQVKHYLIKIPFKIFFVIIIIKYSYLWISGVTIPSEITQVYCTRC
jgi:hypothetical protein